MKKYIACFTISVKEHVAYPGILWTNLLSKLIYIFFQFTLWTTLFKSSGSMKQIESQTETINYILTAAIVSPLFESNVIEWVNGQIRTGNIVLELIRPLDFRKRIFFRCLGETFVQIFFCSLPIYMAVMIFITDYHLCSEQMIYGIFSVILAYGIRFLYSISIGLAAFWLIVTWPLNMLLGAIYKLLSGMWIPVFLFPDLLSRINYFLPFQSIYGIPVTILTSYVKTYRIHKDLFSQLLWILILLGITEVIWKRGRRKIIVQGG